MAFCWLSAFLSDCISTNIYGHFESFLFFNHKIADSDESGHLFRSKADTDSD